MQNGIDVLAGKPSLEECHIVLELLGSILHEERFLQHCSEKDEESAFLALLEALAAAADKKTAKMALWGLSRQQIPTALTLAHLPKLLECLAPFLTLASVPGRSSIASLYAVLTIKNLAARLPDGMRERADMWGPHLWRLMLAEPKGPEYWVEKRQREFEKLRAETADCLKDALPLLMDTEGVAAVEPLQKLLVSDMTGATAGCTHAGEVATPAPLQRRSPRTPRTTPATANKVQLASPSGSSASLGSASWQGKGLVHVLCHMFEGEAPQEAIAVQDVASTDIAESSGLPEEVKVWRRTAAMASLPLLFKLLGGLGITTKGVHKPILNKVLTRAFQCSDPKIVGAAFECWRVLIDALISSKLVVTMKAAPATLINPIEVMLRKRSLPASLPMKTMAVNAWEHLLLASFPETPECTWHASDQDQQFAGTYVEPVLRALASACSTKDPLPCLAERPELLTQVVLSLCQIKRPDIVLLVVKALAGESFLGRLSSTLARHPQLTTSCLQACLPAISTFCTHAITVVDAAVPALHVDSEWCKVLLAFYTQLLDFPGVLNNVECQETSITTLLQISAEVAMTLVKHNPTGDDMVQLYAALDTLKSRLTPAMLSIPIPSLHAASPHSSAGSNSGGREERPMPALSYLLDCWVFVVLLAPSEHRGTCLEKMQAMLTAIDKSPVPVWHLQCLLKSLNHYFRATMDSRSKRQRTGGGQSSAEAGQQGRAPTVLCTLTAHSLGYHLANTEEFEDSPEAAALALQDACGALLLPISHWASLSSRAAACTGAVPDSAAKLKGSSCADDQPATEPDQAPCHVSRSAPGAEAAADAAVSAPPNSKDPPDSSGAERGLENHPGELLSEGEAADFEQAWEALLGSVLAVAALKRSFKKEYCGEIARRISSTAEKLPVNAPALACLQLASSASHVLARQVQKSLSGKHVPEAAQLRRERLDVLRLLGVLLQQLIKHAEQDILVAGACTAQVCTAIAGLLRHTWEDFKVLDIRKLLDPLGMWLQQSSTSTPGQLGEALCSCWVEVLAAVVAQDRPEKSLASALAYRPTYAADMLRPLCHGFTHPSAKIRAASLDLWNNSKVKCTLGKHLAGLPPYVEEALARASEMGFASQPTQTKQPSPKKAARTLLRQPQPASAAVPLAANKPAPSSAGAAAPVQEPKKKRPAAVRLFQETQTEYVRIDTASKRPCRDLLTDHQKEVAARRRQGVGREGVTTFTRMDISQDVHSLLTSSNPVRDSAGDTSTPVNKENSAAAADEARQEPLHAEAGTCMAQPHASQGAEQPSGPALQREQGGPMEIDQPEAAAQDHASAEHRQERGSAQDITNFSRDMIQDTGQQTATAGAVAPQGAPTAGMSQQQQSQSPIQSTPQASAGAAESERSQETAQRSSKGKENSQRARRLPHSSQQQQQQQWRKKRKVGQPGDHGSAACKGSPASKGAQGMQLSAAGGDVQTVMLPEAPPLGCKSPVPSAAAKEGAEDMAAEAEPADQPPGTQQQPASSPLPVPCTGTAVSEPGAPVCSPAGNGVSAVPAEAQTAHDGPGSADHVMQSAVPDSDPGGSQNSQLDHPVEQDRLGKGIDAETAPDIPQTYVQTMVVGSIVQTACAAVPATAIEPEGAVEAPPASALQHFTMPETNIAREEPPAGATAVPLPTSEADVQELQLTGLTQQLGQPPARLDKWTAKHALSRAQRALAGALGELDITVRSVLPEIKALEANDRIGVLQQINELQQALIKGAGKLGDVSSDFYV